VRRLEHEEPAPVEDADALGQLLGLGQVVGAEQNRRVVRLAHLLDELLHLELRARVEPGRRLVEQQEDGRRQQRPRERDLLLHPAGEVLHRLAATVGREADPLEDRRDLPARITSRQPVEAGGIAEVLGRGHLLEERRLDGHPVHQAAHRARLGEDVVPEHTGTPAFVQEEGGEQTDQRRLPRAVLAQDRHALAALDREADAVEGGDSPAPNAQVRALAQPAAVLADELLAQIGHFYGRVHVSAPSVG
jgi:hypothetical protein